MSGFPVSWDEWKLFIGGALIALAGWKLTKLVVPCLWKWFWRFVAQQVAEHDFYYLGKAVEEYPFGDGSNPNRCMGLNDLVKSHYRLQEEFYRFRNERKPPEGE